MLEHADRYLDTLRKFGGVVSPDCSLYTDMPLILQAMNTYFNRAIGNFFQQNGIPVIANVRWGDARSYRGILGEMQEFAFRGVEKDSIVSVGTYGCIKDELQRSFFKDGLGEMLKVIEPKKVLVYGRMPNDIFEDYVNDVQFIRYDDWTTIRKRGH